MGRPIEPFESVPVKPNQSSDLTRELPASSVNQSMLAPGSFSRRRLLEVTPTQTISIPAEPIHSHSIRENVLCHAWEHPRRRLLQLEENEDTRQSRPDISVDDLEEMVMRQLRPNGYNMLFELDSRNEESDASFSLEALMSRLRRQVRSTSEQASLEERPNRRLAQNSTSQRPIRNQVNLTRQSSFPSQSRFRSLAFPRPYENIGPGWNAGGNGNRSTETLSDTFYRWSLIRRNNQSNPDSRATTRLTSESHRTPLNLNVQSQQEISSALPVPARPSEPESLIRTNWNRPMSQSRPFAPSSPFTSNDEQ